MKRKRPKTNHRPRSKDRRYKRREEVKEEEEDVGMVITAIALGCFTFIVIFISFLFHSI